MRAFALLCIVVACSGAEPVPEPPKVEPVVEEPVVEEPDEPVEEGPAPLTPDQIRFTIVGETAATGIDFVCTEPDFKHKQHLRGGTVTISGVPEGASCTASFAGGLPIKFEGATPGSDYECLLASPLAQCGAPGEMTQEEAPG
jgi:hypothetical protein